METILVLNDEIGRLNDKVHQLRVENELLTKQTKIFQAALNEMAAKLVKSEGYEGEAGPLFDKLAADIKASSSLSFEKAPKKGKKKSKKKQRGHGPTKQPNLPLNEPQVLTLEEADLACPDCGDELQPWKGQFEESVEITVVPKVFSVQPIHRQKYRCPCGHIETALPNLKPRARGRYSLEFCVFLAVQKYLNHLPLERLVRAMQWEGLVVTSQTLWDQIGAVADHLTEHYEAVRKFILNQYVIGMDQTGWPRLSKKRKGHRPWQMWALTHEKAAYYAICGDKSAETGKAILGDYDGVIIADRLSTHISIDNSTNILFAGCWAHVFRRFKHLPGEEAEFVRATIGKLYEIEHETEDDLALRARRRMIEGRKLLDDLFDYLELKCPSTTTDLGRAIRYTTKQKEALSHFIGDPMIPLDNNFTERKLRGPVVGRKNHYGSKSKHGTEASAILYTLLETARMNGLNPETWLTEALRAKIACNEIILPFA